MPGVVENLVILLLDFNCAIEDGTYSSLLGPSYTVPPASLFLEAEDKCGVTLNLFFFFRVFVVQVGDSIQRRYKEGNLHRSDVLEMGLLMKWCVNSGSWFVFWKVSSEAQTWSQVLFSDHLLGSADKYGTG